jgi:hypothetical protein
MKLFQSVGWLYADLFLVIAFLFLIIGLETPEIIGSNIIDGISFENLDNEFGNDPTIVPTDANINSATEVPLSERGLETIPEIIFIYRYGDGNLATNIREQMEDFKAKYSDREAGFILVFGYDRNVGDGVNLAKDAMKILKSEFPNTISETTVFRPLFWQPDGSGEEGTVKLEIFFFSPTIGEK